jgi:DNA-binding CsgD family transcriptional regulator
MRMALSGGSPRPDRCGQAHFTAREIEVLRLAAAGFADRQVASVLNISLRTAEFHVAHMLARTGARNRAELVARGYSAGILLVGQWPPVWSGRFCSGVGFACDGGRENTYFPQLRPDMAGPDTGIATGRIVNG